MILAFIGAEVAGGRICLPLPGRVILNPIPGRRLTLGTNEVKLRVIQQGNHGFKKKKKKNARNII